MFDNVEACIRWAELANEGRGHKLSASVIDQARKEVDSARQDIKESPGTTNNSGLMQLLCEIENRCYHVNPVLKREYPVLHTLLNAVVAQLH